MLLQGLKIQKLFQQAVLLSLKIQIQENCAQHFKKSSKFQSVLLLKQPLVQALIVLNQYQLLFQTKRIIFMQVFQNDECFKTSSCWLGFQSLLVFRMCSKLHQHISTLWRTVRSFWRSCHMLIWINQVNLASFLTL